MAHTQDQAAATSRAAIDASEQARAKRREFVRKAATIGLPVVLATVGNRTEWVHAQTTGGGSMPTSATHS